MKITYAIFLAVIALTGCNTDQNETATALQSQDSRSTNLKNLELITVELNSQPQTVAVSGRLEAENRLMIFPEVQGKLLPRAKPFQEGISFKKGETMLQIDSEEIQFQLRSSKSNFRTLLSRTLPDVKMDFPGSFEQINTWYSDIHPDHPFPNMPETDDPQLQQFLSSRGIYDAYFQVKSAESRLLKFTISAPFNGILSAANAEPGQTVSPQVHLGTLVDPDSYILQISMERDQIALANIGSEITVRDQDQRNSWNAQVDRMNPTLDPTSQMISVYLKVHGENLREGLYLEGVFESDEEIQAARIPKSALLRTGQVYIANRDKIGLKPVQVLDIEKDYIRVTGLENGDQIVADAEFAYAGLILQ